MEGPPKSIVIAYKIMVAIVVLCIIALTAFVTILLT